MAKGANGINGCASKSIFGFHSTVKVTVTVTVTANVTVFVTVTVTV